MPRGAASTHPATLDQPSDSGFRISSIHSCLVVPVGLGACRLARPLPDPLRKTLELHSCAAVLAWSSSWPLARSTAAADSSTSSSASAVHCSAASVALACRATISRSASCRASSAAAPPLPLYCVKFCSFFECDFCIVFECRVVYCYCYCFIVCLIRAFAFDFVFRVSPYQVCRLARLLAAAPPLPPLVCMESLDHSECVKIQYIAADKLCPGCAIVNFLSGGKRLLILNIAAAAAVRPASLGTISANSLVRAKASAQGALAAPRWRWRHGCCWRSAAWLPPPPCRAAGPPLAPPSGCAERRTTLYHMTVCNFRHGQPAYSGEEMRWAMLGCPCHPGILCLCSARLRVPQAGTAHFCRGCCRGCSVTRRSVPRARSCW